MVCCCWRSDTCGREPGSFLHKSPLPISSSTDTIALLARCLLALYALLRREGGLKEIGTRNRKKWPELTIRWVLPPLIHSIATYFLFFQSSSQDVPSSRRRVATKPEAYVAPVWPCKINGCGKTFVREADLKRHQRTTKTHSMPSLCVPLSLFVSSRLLTVVRVLVRVRNVMPVSPGCVLGGEIFDAHLGSICFTDRCSQATPEIKVGGC